LNADHLRGQSDESAIFCPAIAQRMITSFSGLPTRSGAAASASRTEAAEFAELTDREREILDLIAQGHNNTVIAQRLVRSVKTVQNYYVPASSANCRSPIGRRSKS
jgi:DNA-binding NarL/FixJ family response regulator